MQNSQPAHAADRAHINEARKCMRAALDRCEHDPNTPHGANPGHMGQGVRCKRYAARARLTPRPREYHMKRTAGSSPVMPCAGFWTCHAAKSPMRPMRMGLRAAARKCCTFTSRARRGCPPLSRRRHTRLSNRSGRRCAPGAGRPDRVSSMRSRRGNLLDHGLYRMDVLLVGDSRAWWTRTAGAPPAASACELNISV